MNADYYQSQTRETAIYPDQGEIGGLSYVTLGLAGEAGEIANKVKKILRDQGGVLNDDNVADLVDEAGDTLWYLARLLDEIGVSMSDAMHHNIVKLQRRQKLGTLGGAGDIR